MSLLRQLRHKNAINYLREFCLIAVYIALALLALGCEEGVDVASLGIDSTDFFDWDVRLDRHEKPAGHFIETPFPIDENSTSYTVMNDEYPTGKTFYLGNLIHVDGAYVGAISTGEFSHPYKSIAAALTAAPDGKSNTTIVIRGPHNSFNGEYNGTYGTGAFQKYGVDDTHRFMLVGYKQERPILDAQNSTDPLISWRNSTDKNLFFTVQRLKLQNTQASCIRLGRDETGVKWSDYFNTVDIHMYQCGYDTLTDLPPAGGTDGSMYYLNADHGWIFHSTSERTFGHGFKIGDGASNVILEWSVARNIGWWPGIALVYGHSAVALDFPADNDDKNQHNNTIRYNIADSSVNYSLQIRRVRNFSAHHNEFIDGVHHDEIPPLGGTLGAKLMIILYAGQVSGDFYSNIIRDPGNPGTALLFIQGEGTNNPEINVYNNLIYGATDNSIRIGFDHMTDTNIWNNTICQDNDFSVFRYRGNDFGLNIKNNIFHQDGTGDVFENFWGNLPIENDYNIFYAPHSSVGDITLNLNDMNVDPMINIPISTFNAGEGTLQVGSPALDAGTTLPNYNNSFNVQIRPQSDNWDVGAYEFNPQF